MGIKLRKTSKKLNLKSQSKNATKHEKMSKKLKKGRNSKPLVLQRERERERERERGFYKPKNIVKNIDI